MAIKDTFCGISEAAEILGCTTGRVRQLLLDGTLTGEKVADLENSPWLIDRKKLAAFAKTRPTTGRPRISTTPAS